MPLQRKHPLAKCEIPLTNSVLVAVIDCEDFELVKDRKWYLTPEGYAKATDHNKRRMMHHVITRQLGVVDHKSGNRLDNRKINVIPTTQSNNAQNKAGRGVTKYKGVYWDGVRCKWIAQICYMYKTKSIGAYLTAEEAARVYDKAVIELRGPNARTNF